MSLVTSVNLLLHKSWNPTLFERRVSSFPTCNECHTVSRWQKSYQTKLHITRKLHLRDAMSLLDMKQNEQRHHSFLLAWMMFSTNVIPFFFPDRSTFTSTCLWNNWIPTSEVVPSRQCYHFKHIRGNHLVLVNSNSIWYDCLGTG